MVELLPDFERVHGCYNCRAMSQKCTVCCKFVQARELNTPIAPINKLHSVT